MSAKIPIAIRTAPLFSVNLNLGRLSISNLLPKFVLTLAWITMALSALLFFSQQGDIGHTVTSSYALYNGHFLDFYEYNKIRVGGNDYLILVYIFFALWMLPLEVLGLTLSNSEMAGYYLSPIELTWAKLGIFVVFGLSIAIFKKLSDEIFISNSKKSRMATLSYATSPLAFFAVGIFNQYDVLGVLFTLLGLLALYRSKWLHFGVFLGLAVSMKFFAAVLVLPLLLFFVPNWRLRILYGGIVALVPILLSLPFVSSPAFQAGVFRISSARAGDSNFLSSIPLLAVLYGGLLVWSLLAGKQAFSKGKAIALIGLISYSLMFAAVFWHPQWLIVIAPFFALAVGYVGRASTLIILEVILFVLFIWFIVNQFPGNVDGTMVLKGPLSSIFETPWFPLTIFFPPEQAPLALLAFEFLILAAPAYLIASRLLNEKTHVADRFESSFLVLRAFSPAIFFIVPALLAVLLPLSIASQFDRDARLVRLTSVDFQIPAEGIVGEMSAGKVLTQTFLADSGNLEAISILGATYARANPGKTVLAVTTLEGVELCRDEIRNGDLIDNQFVTFNCRHRVTAQGSTLQVRIESFSTAAGSSPTFYMSLGDSYTDGALYLDNQTLGGDLVFKLYFSP